LCCAKKNQSLEEDMFSNTDGSTDYEEFLRLLGAKVELNGFAKFSGGLDCRGTNTTGGYSVFAEWEGNEVMFHVSTLLPQSDGQQVHKKRHIGNDIVIIIFQEDGCKPFSPATIKSNYIQVQIVVRVLRDPSGGKNGVAYYHVSIVSQSDVPLFGPPLPYPPIFKHGHEFRVWLLEKLINSELASYRSKLFIQQLRSTYKTLLNEFIDKFPPNDSKRKKERQKKKKLKEKE